MTDAQHAYTHACTRAQEYRTDDIKPPPLRSAATMDDTTIRYCSMGVGGGYGLKKVAESLVGSEILCTFAPGLLKCAQNIMKKIKLEMKRKGLTMQANREDVAIILKTYRLRQGLTQRQLAERWGISRYTLIRIEKGQDISWEMAYRVFALLSEDLRKEGLL